MRPRPRVFSSKCLGFAACRWNGVTIPDKFIDSLKPYVDFVTTCPEADIGLGIPRDPIRIVSIKGELRLMQPATGRDVSKEMKKFTDEFLGSIGEIDGFILKDRSPSCGVSGVKIYPKLEQSAATSRGSGFFGLAVSERFSHLPIETEARLTNFTIREHFLARLFTIASFRSIKDKKEMKSLIRFHADNKFLLMSYNQKELSVMGRIVANHEKKSLAEVFRAYEESLYRALGRAARYTSNMNILLHALGYFKDKLSSSEKKFFLDTTEGYKTGKIPLSVPCNLLKSYIVRFDEKYLAAQTFFEPYPFELVEITDSGKGRGA